MTRQRIDTASTGLSLAWSQTVYAKTAAWRFSGHNALGMHCDTGWTLSPGADYLSAGRTAFLAIRYGSR